MDDRALPETVGGEIMIIREEEKKKRRPRLAAIVLPLLGACVLICCVVGVVIGTANKPKANRSLLGQSVSTDIDECQSNPCQHNSSCTDDINGYACECELGYEGTNCDVDTDECQSNPCQHNSFCEDDINRYSCQCEIGYVGTNCEIAVCPPEWKIFDNMCYYFGTYKFTWNEAEDYCQCKGGHLAKDTIEVHSFLAAEVSKLDTSGCDPLYTCNLFIGLLFEPSAGYRWSDGTVFDDSFMPWNTPEPNNDDVQSSVELIIRTATLSNILWNDRPIITDYPYLWYICEKTGAQ